MRPLISQKRLLVLILLVALNSLAQSAEENQAKAVSFYKDIRPIFQANCQGCHQPSKDKGKYIMTDFEKLIKGGDSGDPAIVPGDPQNSYLVEVITPIDGEAEMPQKADPLHETEIALINKWVLEGAKVLNDKHADAKVRVLDATNATNGHQLCSDQITYPKEQNYGANYPPNGPAQQGPPWAGVRGGSTGPWINPISVCIEEQQDVRFFCNWKTTYPTLFNAMQCEPSDPSQSDCQTGALANAQSLPIHPNHWGQRALAACHANAAASAQPGDITACTPPADSLGLDAYGRPKMVVTKSGSLANFTPKKSTSIRLI